MIRALARTYVRAFSGLPPVVWRMCLVTFLTRAGTMVVPFLTLYLTLERGMGVAEAGRFLAVWGAGSIAGSWVGGQAADRIGPVKVQWASCLLGGLSLIVLERMHDPRAFAAVLFASGLSMDAFRPANMSAIARAVPPALRAKAFALLRQAVNLGMGVGPAAGGVLAAIDYRWLFVANGVALWLAALSLIGLAEPVPARAAADDGRPVSPWTDAPFLLLLGWTMGLWLVFFQLFGTWPLYLNEHYSFAERGIGGLFAFNAALVLIFEMILIHWAADRDRTPLISGGVLLVCAGMFLLPFGTGLGWATFTVLVWTVGEMLSLPLLNAVVAEHAPEHASGRYIGAYSMTFSSALIAAPALGTAVYATFGPDRLWEAVGVLGPLLAISFVPIGRALGRSARPPVS